MNEEFKLDKATAVVISHAWRWFQLRRETFVTLQ
jgi:hypothetical protein